MNKQSKAKTETTESVYAVLTRRQLLAMLALTEEGNPSRSCVMLDGEILSKKFNSNKGERQVLITSWE